MSFTGTTIAHPVERTPAPEPTTAAVPLSYGRLTSRVLAGAFTLSAAHTVYCELTDTADPDFRVTSPLVWAFYAAGFGAAAAARRPGRRRHVALLAYLTGLLGVSVLYYPTTFTEARQTTFGWIENDLYVGLLLVAAVLTTLRLRGVQLGGPPDRETARPPRRGARSIGAAVVSPTATDVHDMVVVHRAFRREFDVVPGLVRRVPAGDLGRAAVVAAHLRLCLAGLHLHHTSEDDLLWPLLAERAAPSAELVRRMQDQHAAVEHAIGRIDAALGRWEAEARPAVGAELAELVDGLREDLLVHLDEEEHAVLPLAARHLDQAEWAAIGQAGVAKMTRAQLPLMFGMVMEDATDEERREMLGVLPPPVRLLLRTWGARHYRRYVSCVREGR